ncbi:MAG TPA: hypothetical protein VGF29_16780 [Hyphomicrobiaceae bacterium]
MPVKVNAVVERLAAETRAIGAQAAQGRSRTIWLERGIFGHQVLVTDENGGFALTEAQEMPYVQALLAVIDFLVEQVSRGLEPELKISMGDREDAR